MNRLSTAFRAALLVVLGLAGTAAAQPYSGLTLRINGPGLNPGGYVTIPDSPSLRPTEFTLEGYFNFSDSTSGPQILIVKPIEPANQTGTMPAYASFVMFYGGQQDTFLVGRIGTENGFVTPAVKAGFYPTRGRWYHLAFELGSTVLQTAPVSVLRLFIDGNLVATQYLPSGPSPRIGDGGLGRIERIAATPRYDASKTVIGGVDSQGGLGAHILSGLPLADGSSSERTSPGRALNIQEKFFHGRVDEIRIWKIALTETQIQQSMNKTIQNPPSDLVLNLHFNLSQQDNPNNTLQDNTIYGNDGNIVGDYDTPVSTAPINGIDAPLPVELTGFSGSSRNGAVNLSWRTGAEHDNAGFSVLRDGVEIASFRSTLGLVGRGTTANPTNYTYTDARVVPGKSYRYTLRSVDLSGASHESGHAVTVTVEATVSAVVPSEFALLPAAPNPFNPSTQLTFTLPAASRVTLTAYDALGRAVRTIMADQSLPASVQHTSFDGAGLPSGLYIVRMRAVRVDGLGQYQDAQRVVLAR